MCHEAKIQYLRFFDNNLQTMLLPVVVFVIAELVTEFFNFYRLILETFRI